MRCIKFSGILRYKQITKSRTRRPDLVIINKKEKRKKENLLNSELCYPGRFQSEKSEKKRDKFSDFAREIEKLYNMKITKIPVVIGVFGTISKGMVRELEEFEIEQWDPDYPNYSTVTIGPAYWVESWRPEETCCHSGSSERQLANTSMNIS